MVEDYVWLDEGHVPDDAGNLIVTTYIDPREEGQRTPIPALVKGCRREHALEDRETITRVPARSVSTVRRGIDQGRARRVGERRVRHSSRGDSGSGGEATSDRGPERSARAFGCGSRPGGGANPILPGTNRARASPMATSGPEELVGKQRPQQQPLSSRIRLKLGDDASDQRFRIELVGSLFSLHGFATPGCATIPAWRCGQVFVPVRAMVGSRLPLGMRTLAGRRNRKA